MEIYELREQLKDVLEKLNRKDSYHSPRKKDNKYAHKSDLEEYSRYMIRKSKDDGNSLRLDIPNFDGSMDTEIFVEWLKHVEWVFDYKYYDDHKRFKIARSKLKGYANLWYELLESKRREEDKTRIDSWKVLKRRMNKRFIPTDYLQDILVESHGVNHDAISFDDDTIGFEKKVQNVAHSCAEISLKYDALKKDDDNTTPLAIEDQLVDLKCKGYEHVQEESPNDLVMNMRDTENITTTVIFNDGEIDEEERVEHEEEFEFEIEKLFTHPIVVDNFCLFEKQIEHGLEQVDHGNLLITPLIIPDFLNPCKVE